METGTSVSRGTFAYKGKKKQVNAAEFFGACDQFGTHKQRLDVLQESWELIDTQIQILRSDLNSKIFDDLMTFAKSSHEFFSFDETRNESSKEIPTAAFVTGVNTPDHGVMFATLVASLQENVSPLVAILKSKDCNSVKNTLSKTLGQLFQNPLLFSDEEEENIPLQTRNITCSMTSLVSWYKEKYQTGNSSPKKRKSCGSVSLERGQFPPVIILFEDLECFLPHVLQDFVAICRNYITQIPLVFVFGIATSVSAVHRLLPHAVSSMLCMEKFQAPPSTDYLNMVINQILMTSKYPFKLGSKVFQLLLDIFLYHDFSVLNFIKGLQFAMMDHFFNIPVSHLCCQPEDLPNFVHNLKTREVEQVRRLFSFRGFVESCPPSKQEDLLLNDKVTKDEILILLQKIHKYHELFYPVLKCLHILVSKIPKHPLGKQLREVYSKVLKTFICDTQVYKECFQLLRMTSKDELTDLIQQCRMSLEGDIPLELSHLPTEMDMLLQQFASIDKMTADESTSETVTEEPLHLEKTDLQSLRKKLLEDGKKKKRESPYEKLRNEALDFFDTVFREYLVCPSSLPLHEIFYYDSWEEVKRHLNASPRSAVQVALSSPHHYLQCKCCAGEAGSITGTMPDVCIVYKLHLECTQLINLYDWLQAFITVVSSDENETEQSKNPDKELQARFIRAVSELQFLGFVKPTKRKTDHVARLTWGGC